MMSPPQHYSTNVTPVPDCVEVCARSIRVGLRERPKQVKLSKYLLLLCRCWTGVYGG